MKKAIMIFCAALILMLVGSAIGIFTFVKAVYTAAELPPNFDELLNAKYGESDYKVTHEGISLDIERIYQEKYFIKYSWFEYDKSNFSAIFFIYDENQNPLSKKAEVYATLLYNQTEHQTLVSPFIADYPLDNPLFYKQKLHLSFAPLPEDIKSVTFKVVYKNQTYVFADIPLY